MGAVNVRRVGQVNGLVSPILERIRLRAMAGLIKPGASVLDIGCGRGRILGFLKAPARYVGVDTMEDVIEEDRRVMPGAEFIVLDVESGPLPGGLSGFDAVVMGAVLEHLARPAEVLKRLGRALNDGGRILLTTPSPRGRALLRAGASVRLLSPEAEEEHERLYSRGDIEELAREAGFRMTHYRTFLMGLNQLAVLDPEERARCAA